MKRKTLTHVNISGLFVLFSLLSLSGRSFASSGTEGASFLDIPVGAGPAALGGAYSALANDAYAPVFNPAGLGFLESNQIAGQHLSYLDSINYEYASFVHPFGNGKGLGGSVQYLGSGDITQTDNTGNSIGSFSSRYASYNLAYGQKVTDRLSLGATGKIISAKISDVGAQAYAFDFGSLYALRSNLTLAATLTNLGTHLNFLSEGDPLPLSFHVGASYLPTNHWLLVADGDYAQNSVSALHMGAEWNPIDMVSIRAGYRTDTLKGLSAIAGFSTGIGIHVWGQEFSYAWVPYGDLGNTQYFSLVIKFGAAVDKQRQNLIKIHDIKRHQTASKQGSEGTENNDQMQLMQLLDQDNNKAHVAENTNNDNGGVPFSEVK